MLRVLGLVVAIALGDSLNPSTIAPALFVASGERPRTGVFEFTLAVFVVHFAGGAIIVIGPGQLLLSLLNDLGRTTQYALELGAGIAMLGASATVWHQRDRLAQKSLPDPNPKRKSRVLLGATITAVELPTAFPYLAAVGAVLGLGTHVARQLLLVGVYNVCFVLPLLAILVTRLLAGERTEELLARGRKAVERRWPLVFAGLLLLGGLLLAVSGAVNLA